MQRVTVALICSLLFFCFGPISAERTSKCRHDKVDQVRERSRGTRKYCDPSFSNQTAGEITQVRQLFGRSSQVNHVLAKSL